MCDQKVFEIGALGLHFCIRGLICCIISGVFIIGHCLFGLGLAELVKGYLWCFCCTMLVTSPPVIGEKSGVWHVDDSTAGLWVELGSSCPVGDCTPGHQEESGPGSAW